MTGPGKVYLVGAGPGDPGLVTLRAVECIRKADVIVTDRLAHPSLISYARPGAKVIYAGKASRDHTLKQNEINALLANEALAGNTVVRLKGGDPFVFGRGGEEAEALAENGVEFEVIPGISSSVAVPAYAGIPVTHRGIATSFAVVTGHESPGKSESDIRWEKLATGVDTLVFLMGVENLPNIVDGLISNGRDARTPVAVIRWGTHPNQKTVTGNLGDIVEKCDEAGMTPPAVTVVGEVVKLRETISWFETRPLFGKRVVVTRAQHQASALSSRLAELGAEVLEFPVIEFVAPPDYGPLDDAIRKLGLYDWVIFTSANGVEWFTKRLEDSGLDIRALAGPKLGAIGPRTAAALKQMRLRVDFVPSEYVAESVVTEFPDDPSGKRILIPRALEAREELPDGLEAGGAEVDVVPVYETVADESHAEELRQALADGRLDMITFTSASTVYNFMRLAGEVKVPDGVVIACIGPVTADAAREFGLEPDIVAREYTIQGLVKAVLEK